MAVLPDGKHIGILYRKTISENVRLLHLANHHSLRNDEVKSKYFFVIPDVGRRGKQVAALCRLIIEQNPTLPYGFSHPTGAFNEEGKFIAGPNMVGLTCASFVLAVFDKVGLSLLQYDTWQTRDDDEAWRAEIIEIIRHSSTSNDIEDHIKQITPEVPTVRYRPLEVAGSAAADFPVPFCKSLILADQLAKILIDHKSNPSTLPT